MTRDDQILAAELTLGLLEGAERETAVERTLADPAFAREVAWWRQHLASAAGDYVGAEPPSDLLKRVEEALDERSVMKVARPRPWRWAAAGALSGALAATLAALMLLPSTPPPVVVPQPTRPLLVAALAPSAGEKRAPVAVVVDTEGRALRLAGTFEIPSDRTAELWRIGADKVPVALGLIGRDDRGLSLIGPVPRADEVIAVSVEPAGGAPGTAPTGPVIATGKLQRI